MDISGPSISEGTARFWNVVFGGITAVSLLAAGGYTLVQHFENKEKESVSRQLQIATAVLAAKEGFNTKHLELCSEATAAAGTIATSKDTAKKQLAEDTFWRLYWGALGIVEGSDVEKAMVAFGECLRGSCARPPTFLALDLAHACRAEVSKDFELKLPDLPKRPDSGSAK
jgi:hypothetical protein